MKKISLWMLALGLCWQMNAQDLPQPSPAAELEQTIGLTEVEIEYSRPSVKGRTIFGDLVPYDKVWRTGANKATAIEFSTDVKIEGQAVKAGKYSIFTKPGKEMWEVYINSNTELWGETDMKMEENVATFKVKPEAAAMTESMLFYFDNLSDGGATLYLAWDKVKIGMKIEVDYMTAAKQNIDKAIKDLNNGFRVYNSSARYYLDNNLDNKQALEWAKKSTEMKKTFWNMKTLSEAYAANGMTKEAIAAATEGLKMAEEAKYEPYIKMHKENLAKWQAKK